MRTMFMLAASGAARGAWWPDVWYGRVWIFIGLAAQAAFFSRFLVQWIASERARRSYMPVVFWYLSLLGGLMLLSYACFWKHDVAIALGELAAIIVYVRNIMLLRAANTSPGQRADSWK